jgi:hypothetical protein
MKAVALGKKSRIFKLRDYRSAEPSLKGFAEHKRVVLASTGTEMEAC